MAQDINKLEAIYSSSKTSQNGKKQAEPGTVIHGTMQTKDLINAFTHYLFEHDKELIRAYYKDNLELLEAICNDNAGIETDYWSSDNAAFTLDELFALMDMLSPECYYFGSHIGDASDYGYWQQDDDDTDVL